MFLRRLRASVATEPTGFVWIEKGKLAASGYPASRGQLNWLAKSGIQTILTLTESPLPKEWTEGLPLEFIHISLKDHQPPDLASLSKASDVIKNSLDSGRAILVHCLAGEGRTGCVLSAYLIKVKKMGAAEAMSYLRQIKPAFVERSQQKAVMEFALLQAD